MHALIAVLPGDGIGAEVTHEAVRALEAVASRHGHSFRFETALLGGAAIDATGDPLPAATLAACRRADAILMGAVGGPKWSDPNAKVRPEQGLLQLRKALGLFANLRPVVPHPAVLDASPIKAELLHGVDIMVVRELTGGIYFGDKHRTETEATDICRYTVAEIERVVRLAAGLARQRSRRLTSVDKANVLETSRLWRGVVERLLPAEFPEVRFEHMLVDSAAMHLIKRPRDFDVIVTENMFGDILTDEASMLAGSLGMLPSASLGSDSRGGLYEPIHGSAPDIARKGIANPVATIWSVSMMLDHLGEPELGAALLTTIECVIAEQKVRTPDLGGQSTTRQMGQAVIAALQRDKAS
jgi:3-isopropylmalate dehydrogenase